MCPRDSWGGVRKHLKIRELRREGEKFFAEMARHRETFWYALKVFYRRRELVLKDFRELRYEAFFPVMFEETVTKGKVVHKEVPVMASLLFVKCTERALKEYKQAHNDLLMYYPEPGTNIPGKISDEEMESFRKVTARPDPNVKFLGSEQQAFVTGEKVRVKDGIYKGVEGYIKRIDRNKRLLVCLSGIAVVMLSYIEPQYLEKVD